MMKELAETKAKIAKMEDAVASGVSLKTTQYGALQVLGIRGGYLGFYRCEWKTIMDLSERIQEYLDDHEEILTKAESYEKIPADARKK